MMVEHEAVEAFRITQLLDLDPVAVVLTDYSRGSGRVTIECYGAAWSTYFGAMGDKTLREFLPSCSEDYLANRLLSPQHKRNKSDLAYLRRIVAVVQEAIRALQRR